MPELFDIAESRPLKNSSLGPLSKSPRELSHKRLQTAARTGRLVHKSATAYLKKKLLPYRFSWHTHSLHDVFRNMPARTHPLISSINSSDGHDVNQKFPTEK